jgi:hypothetical protein
MQIDLNKAEVILAMWRCDAFQKHHSLTKGLPASTGKSGHITIINHQGKAIPGAGLEE